MQALRGTCYALAMSSCLFALIAAPALARSAFSGVWTVQDTAHKPFQITLSPNGAAKANLKPGMAGRWKAHGDSAVIHWNTGWTTKIWRRGGGDYTKAGFRKGLSVSSAPTNHSSAEKVR